jgi:DNA-binding SARP family transcriptional activator/tetratricopeptide (TPR) repeat protein
LLGPIEVFDGERRLPLAGTRQLSLLSVLVVHANQAVSADTLIETLWEGRDPAGAPKRLQMAVARLRKTLAAGRADRDSDDALQTVPGGYLLRLEQGQLDVEVFRDGVASGRRLLAAGRAAEAATALGNALALWRGPPLAEVTFASFAVGVIAGLEEERLSAVEARVEADLLLGRHAALTGELAELVAVHPDREALTAHLMLALYRSGRQADALEAFHRLRRRLRADLGLEPGPTLQQMQAAILSQDPELGAPGTATDGASDPDEASGRLPLPAPAGMWSTGAFVGREPELRQLSARLRDAAQNAPALVLLSGEPGIGKTRLATHAASRAHAQGSDVLFGRCSEQLSVPYEPWLPVLEHLVAHLPDDVLHAHLARHGGELDRIVPLLSRRLRDVPAPRRSDPETERYLLLSALVDLLRRAAQPRPLVLVLDDLHWADHPSLMSLRQLLLGAAAGVTVIGTYRDSEVPAGHPLLELAAEAGKTVSVERLALTGLSDAEVADFIETVAGQTLDGAGLALAAEIWRETDGNPFFVTEVLRHVRDVGAITQGPDRRWEVVGPLAKLQLPQTVREVISGRVKRLGAESAAVLGIAAVVGHDFDLSLVADVASQDQDVVLELAQSAARASLVVESTERPGRFSFAHPLVSRTMYDELGATRRASLHRRIAKAIEVQTASDFTLRAGELAHHWLATARPEDAARAIGAALLAGQQALAQLAPHEAVDWFTRGLACDEAAPAIRAGTRCDLLIGLGTARRQIGDPAGRATLLDAARLALEAGDTTRLADAVLANNRGSHPTSYREVDSEQVALIEAALSGVSRDRPALRARLLSLLAIEVHAGADIDRCRALSDEAVMLARRAGDRRALADVLRSRYLATWIPGAPHERQALTQELLAVARGLDDPLLDFWAVFNRGIALIENAQILEGRQALHTCMTRATELDQPNLIWSTLYMEACLEMMGDLDRAETLAARAFEIGNAAGEPDAMMIYGGQLSLIRIQQGRAEEVVEVLKQSAAAFPTIPAFHAAHGWALIEADRDDDARAIAQEACARGFDAIPRDELATVTLALYSELAARVGSDAMVVDLLDRWSGISERLVWNGAVALGAVDYFVGILTRAAGRIDEAHDLLSSAISLAERTGTTVIVQRARHASNHPLRTP